MTEGKSDRTSSQLFLLVWCNGTDENCHFPPQNAELLLEVGCFIKGLKFYLAGHRKVLGLGFL